MSYRVGIKTKGDSHWVYNSLRFASMADAEAYADDIFKRWIAITDYVVEASLDGANATFPVPSDRYRCRGRGPP